MLTTTISPKFQIAIPKEVRETMELRAGTKVHIVPYQDRIEFIPIRAMSSMKGFIKAKFNTSINRDKDRM